MAIRATIVVIIWMRQIGKVAIDALDWLIRNLNDLCHRMTMKQQIWNQSIKRCVIVSDKGYGFSVRKITTQIQSILCACTWLSLDLRRLIVPPLITPFMSQQLFVCVDVDVMPRWWLLLVLCRSWHWFTFPLWIDNGWWWCNFFGDNCYKLLNAISCDWFLCCIFICNSVQLLP